MVNKKLRLICNQCGKEFESNDIDNITCSKECYKNLQKGILKINKSLLARGFILTTCSKCKVELIYNCKINCHKGCMAYKCFKCGFMNCKTPLKFYTPPMGTMEKKIWIELAKELIG